mgnify:CR=1 FL=1
MKNKKGVSQLALFIIVVIIILIIGKYMGWW